MVEGNAPLDSWTSYSLQQLETPINNTKAAGKFTFLVDKTGNVATFANYKGHLVDIQGDSLRVLMNQGTWPDVGEKVRKGFVNGMRSGDSLYINVERASPEWSSMDQAGTWDTATFFNYAAMLEDANYLPFVKEDENHGVGGLNPGHYCRHSDFRMTIVTQNTDQETITAMIEKIPGFWDNFHHAVIE